MPVQKCSHSPVLVKFECGCIGFDFWIGGPDGGHPIIRPCDGDRYNYEDFNLVTRNMTTKSREVLNEKEATPILDVMGGLFADAYRFRVIRDALIKGT